MSIRNVSLSVNCWTFPISSFSSMHLLDCIVTTIDGWPFRCNGGHARIRDSARILVGTQIGHVTLWHSPNDCNTLRHCSQPLHACTHLPSHLLHPTRLDLPNNALRPMMSFRRTLSMRHTRGRVHTPQVFHSHDTTYSAI